MRIHHAWGVEDDSIAGFASWNGRIVATLHLSRHLDSLVRHAPAAYAAVERTDTASPPDSDSTARAADSTRAASGQVAASGAAAPRAESAAAVRGAARPSDSVTRRPASAEAANPGDSVAHQDSVCARQHLSGARPAGGSGSRLDRPLAAQLAPPPYDRLVNTLRSQSTEVRERFGNGNRLAVAVDLRAGASEWIRERAVLIDTLGRVTNLRVYDYRFKAHDFLAALDPTGSGTNGVVARGLTQGEGGVVILSSSPAHT